MDTESIDTVHVNALVERLLEEQRRRDRALKQADLEKVRYQLD